MKLAEKRAVFKARRRRESEADLPPELEAQIKALVAMPDEEIDTVDIPERTDWTGAQRGMFRPVKQQLTLRLDADLVAWFRKHPQGRGYQSRINQALREYMDRHED
ncbi:BrnA antitoxin family protein [Nitrospirillum viridazoti]|uniref:Uncharacterized protein (DUF4415 family) n=1 Tax=Nitrospirillum amazonense TaxID=28077 RepID=A0A560HNF3_9PROT|nr:BrnA antitoxin family protein [Nitrospirillum amazonense]TWB47039.1 uncharacterized protein (DUF4415 family) [Nitrospirillum amazonense]